MKIEVGGQTYTVRIEYYNETHRTLVGLFYDDRAESYSEYSSSAAIPLRVGVGSALCSANDNFCKATGRRIAFGRALQDHGFSKTERLQAWKQFFAQTGNKKFRKFMAEKLQEQQDILWEQNAP